METVIVILLVVLGGQALYIQHLLEEIQDLKKKKEGQKIEIVSTKGNWWEQ